MARFVRKHPDASGTYLADFRGDLLKIEGRSVYETDDKKTIEFLRADPEVVEVNNKTQIESTEE